MLALSLFSLLSCSNYSKIISEAKENKSRNLNTRYFDNQVEPSFPEDSENNKSLLGIDSNNNKVRDDIDIWINYVGINFNHRMGLRQLAKAENAIINAYSDPTVDLNLLARNYWDANICVRYVEVAYFNFENMPSDKMTSLIINTSKRREAYETYRRASVIYQSNNKNVTTLTSYLACDFNVENLSDLINQNRSAAKKLN